MNLTWTEEEKAQLLIALQTHGLSDISKIVNNMPTKSLEEIKYAITLYQKKAKRILKPTTGDDAPMDEWLNILRNLSADQLHTKTVVTALRLIAEREEFTDTEVNLKDCYLYLADLMSGELPKKLDDASQHFIVSCCLAVAKKVVKMDTREYSEYLRKLKPADLVQKSYRNKKRASVTQPDLNLLKIPANLLKIKKVSDDGEEN